MSGGTPTVGSLRRRLERIEQEQRQDVERDVADLEARMETVEAEMGLLDGEDGDVDYRSYEDWGPDEVPEPPTKEDVLEAVRDGIRESERRKRRRTASITMDDGREETREYEDPTPSFVGEDSVQVIERIERPVFVGDEIFYDDDQGRPTVGNDWVHCGCGEYHIDVSECGPIYEFGAICPECDNHFGWDTEPAKFKEGNR